MSDERRKHRPMRREYILEDAGKPPEFSLDGRYWRIDRRSRPDNEITLLRTRVVDLSQVYKEAKEYLEDACTERDDAKERVAELERERDEALDILWRDIDDLRDPKLTLVQVAAKAANAIHWRQDAS